MVFTKRAEIGARVGTRGGNRHSTRSYAVLRAPAYVPLRNPCRTRHELPRRPRQCPCALDLALLAPAPACWNSLHRVGSAGWVDLIQLVDDVTDALTASLQRIELAN